MDFGLLIIQNLFVNKILHSYAVYVSLPRYMGGLHFQRTCDASKRLQI